MRYIDPPCVFEIDDSGPSEGFKRFLSSLNVTVIPEGMHGVGTWTGSEIASDMDYKELLSKYMDLIIHEEGISYLRFGQEHFTEEEFAELKAIEALGESIPDAEYEDVINAIGREV